MEIGRNALAVSVLGCPPQQSQYGLPPPQQPWHETLFKEALLKSCGGRGARQWSSPMLFFMEADGEASVHRAGSACQEGTHMWKRPKPPSVIVPTASRC